MGMASGYNRNINKTSRTQVWTHQFAQYTWTIPSDERPMPVFKERSPSLQNELDMAGDSVKLDSNVDFEKSAKFDLKMLTLK